MSGIKSVVVGVVLIAIGTASGTAYIVGERKNAEAERVVAEWIADLPRFVDMDYGSITAEKFGREVTVRDITLRGGGSQIAALQQRVGSDLKLDLGRVIFSDVRLKERRGFIPGGVAFRDAQFTLQPQNMRQTDIRMTLDAFDLLDIQGDIFDFNWVWRMMADAMAGQMRMDYDIPYAGQSRLSGFDFSFRDIGQRFHIYFGEISSSQTDLYVYGPSALHDFRFVADNTGASSAFEVGHVFVDGWDMRPMMALLEGIQQQQGAMQRCQSDSPDWAVMQQCQRDVLATALDMDKIAHLISTYPTVDISDIMFRFEGASSSAGQSKHVDLSVARLALENRSKGRMDHFSFALVSQDFLITAQGLDRREAAVLSRLTVLPPGTTEGQAQSGTLALRFEKKDGRVTLAVEEGKIGDLAYYAGEVVLTGMPWLDEWLQRDMDQIGRYVSLISGWFELENRGWVELWLAHQAEARGKTIAEIKNEAIAEIERDYVQTGLGESAKEAVIRFIENPRRLRFSLSPAHPIHLDHLEQLEGRPDQAMRVLGLKIESP